MSEQLMDYLTDRAAMFLTFLNIFLIPKFLELQADWKQIASNYPRVLRF